MTGIPRVSMAKGFAIRPQSRVTAKRFNWSQVVSSHMALCLHLTGMVIIKINELLKVHKKAAIPSEPGRGLGYGLVLGLLPTNLSTASVENFPQPFFIDLLSRNLMRINRRA